MDKLESIFALQQKFDDYVISERNLNHITREEWIQKQTLAMMDELGELINEVNYKWWKNPKIVDDDKVKGELVDIMHFFISMCAKMGMDADELYKRYCRKNQENFDRQNGKSAKPGYDLADLG